MGWPEQEELASYGKQLFSGLEEQLIGSYRSNRDKVSFSGIFGLRSRLFKSLSCDVGLRQTHDSNNFSKKCALPFLRLDHRQAERGSCDLQRNGRGSPSRTQIEPNCWNIRKLFRGRQRLNEKAIEGLICRRIERERREVDLRVPLRQQPEIGFERIEHRQGDRRFRSSGPASQSISEFERGHD